MNKRLKSFKYYYNIHCFCLRLKRLGSGIIVPNSCINKESGDKKRWEKNMKTVPQNTEQVLMQRLNTIQKRRINETGNELENSTLLGSRRERVSLLKAGFESKD